LAGVQISTEHGKLRGMGGVEIWLVAIRDDVSEEEVRRYWNVEEAPALNLLIESAPRFRLGMTEPPSPGNDGRRGPVGRVFDFLFLLGTTPTYQLPVVEHGLEQQLLDAFLPQEGDPDFDVAPIEALAAFLVTSQGNRLAMREKAL
jgi:hypothetical protein